MQQWKLIFILLILAIITTWLAIFSLQRSEVLQIVACDVGQGDALLIQQGNTQVLVDGGQGDRVIDCLSRYIPFWDRTIEVVILTHPDADHAEGLIEVVRRYSVNYFMASEFDKSTQGYGVLKNEVGVRQIQVLNPLPSKDLRAGMIYLDILFPTEAYDIDSEHVLGTNTTKEGLNLYSIVFELRYKNFEMLFTGDIGPENMQEIIASGIDDTDILKVPHHGSKNGLTEELLESSTPEIAIISVGKNSYGHPHKEVIELLSNNGVEILRTDESGDVVIYTDGERIVIRNQ